MRVKFFQSFSKEIIEDQINQWLEENEDIHILGYYHVGTVRHKRWGSPEITVSILYRPHQTYDFSSSLSLGF